MKTLLLSTVVLALAEVSLQGYGPPLVRTAPEPVCRKVPKEVCEQVPKTVYDTVSRRECHDVADTVCADVQERKCQISQKPVQETISRQQCSLQYKKDCQTATDIEKRCQQEFKEECHSVPELKCVNLPRTVQETIHEEECSTEFDQECSTRFPRPYTTPSPGGSVMIVADTVCADVQERKCQISQRPVQETVSRQQCSLQYKKDCQTANDIKKRAWGSRSLGC